MAAVSRAAVAAGRNGRPVTAESPSRAATAARGTSRCPLRTAGSQSPRQPQRAGGEHEHRQRQQQGVAGPCAPGDADTARGR